MHFFWGSFDLAVTRFSGRPAPETAGSGQNHARSLFARRDQRGLVARRGRRCGCCVLRLRGAGAAGFRESHRSPAKASYNSEFNEFILPYDDVRAAADPKAALVGIPRKHLRRGRRTWETGIAQRWRKRSYRSSELILLSRIRCVA